MKTFPDVFGGQVLWEIKKEKVKSSDFTFSFFLFGTGL